MRLLQVVSSTDRRGAQVFGADLHDALAARGRDVRTVALTAGERAHGLPLPVLGASRLNPATLRALRREIARADVVVAHGSSTLPACALAALGLATPFVYRNIGDLRYWVNSPARVARVRLLLGRAAAVAALWDGAADTLTTRLGVPAGKVAVIPNGVPAERFPPSDPARRPAAKRRFGLAPEVPVVLYVGALTPEKDLFGLLDAVAALPAAQLLVVGDGPLRARLEERAAGIQPRPAVFAGDIAAPRAAYAAADVVCLPSRSEGMPGVLIEAGLCGVPAVATDVGAVGEVVTARTGRLVPHGDATALAKALAAVLTDAGPLGAQARQHCLERFEIGVVAEAWDDLLAAVATGGLRRPGSDRGAVSPGRAP